MGDGQRRTYDLSALSVALRDAVAGGADAIAIDYYGATYSWSDIGRGLASVGEVASQLRLQHNARVAFVGVNSPGHVVALLGLLTHGACVVTVNGHQNPSKIAHDISVLNVEAVVAAQDQWTPELVAACEIGAVAAIVVSRTLAGDIITLSTAAPARGSSSSPAAATGEAALALEMLTSGTTGPPKRIPFTYRGLLACVRGLLDMDAGNAGSDRPLTEPTWSAGSLVHISGFVNICALAVAQRTIILRDKFTVDEWRRAIARYRPQISRVAPSMINMVLASDVTRAEVASLRAVRAGSAPLSPASKAAFLERFSIPVLAAYGATEFGGAIAAWSLDLHNRYAASKAPSAGRVMRSLADVRIVSPDTGAPLRSGESGLLEARLAAFGPNWIRSNDIAVLDGDDFVFIEGRVDRVINRGGFKISPEPIELALREHPGVLDAAVIAVDDDRLGQVPVAFVELRPDAATPSVGEITDFLRERLVRYHLPVRITVVPALPRTSSLKVSLQQLQELAHV